jgi:hypothetical protein
MVVGGGVIENKIQLTLNNYIFENSNINSGTYIGYAKNIKLVLSDILNKLNIQDTSGAASSSTGYCFADTYGTASSSTGCSFADDQVELIKYARQQPNDIHIDTNNDFFCVISKPLQQINLNGNKKCSFIHANGNGCLEDYLWEHHNINCDINTRVANYIIHSYTIITKIYTYLKQLFFNYVYCE